MFPIRIPLTPFVFLSFLLSDTGRTLMSPVLTPWSAWAFVVVMSLHRSRFAVFSHSRSLMIQNKKYDDLFGAYQLLRLVSLSEPPVCARIDFVADSHSRHPLQSFQALHEHPLRPLYLHRLLTHDLSTWTRRMCLDLHHSRSGSCSCWKHS